MQFGEHISSLTHAGRAGRVPVMVILLALLAMLGAGRPVVAQPDQPAYRPGEVLVKFRESASVLGVRQTLAARAGHTPVSGDLHKVMIRPGETVEQVVIEFESLPDVEFAEPNYIRRIQQLPLPDDDLFENQWALENTGQSFNGPGGTPGDDIGARQAWSVTTGSDDVIVAVIDSGIDLDHPELADNLWNGPGGIAGRNFVDDNFDPEDVHGHGTQMAGIIGARGNNGAAIAGVAWQVQLMALRVTDENGNGTTAEVVAAIDYAVANGADILNISLGADNPTNSERAAIDNAEDAGVLIVASACNTQDGGQDNDMTPCYPASYDNDNIISVAATDNSDGIIFESNFGAQSVDLGAPGGFILTLHPEGNPSPFPFISGTSAAAAFVSGAAALVKAENPAYSALELKEVLLDSVDPAPNLQGITVTGGRLNAANALQAQAQVASTTSDGGGGGSGAAGWRELLILLLSLLLIGGFRIVARRRCATVSL